MQARSYRRKIGVTRTVQGDDKGSRYAAERVDVDDGIGETMSRTSTDAVTVSPAFLAGCLASFGLAGAVFRESQAHMLAGWRSPDYTHCFIMPAVIGYLVWERRRALALHRAAPSWGGLAPLAAGVGFYWLGELGGEYFTLYIGFFLVLTGLLWLQLGREKLRVLLFPLLLVPTLFPLPNFFKTQLTFKLQLLSSALGVKTLQLLGIPALREGNVIDLGFTQLQVVEACSGLRFVFPLVILSVLLASFLRGPLWKRAVLAVSALPLAVFLNGLRIAATGLLHHWLGPQVAEGFFHDFSGWLVFMAALGILLAEMAILAKMGRRGLARGDGDTLSPGRAQGTADGSPISDDPRQRNARARRGARAWMPLYAGLVVLGATAGISSSVDFRKEVPPARDLAAFPAVLGPWRGERSLMDPRILDALDLSDYTAMTYRNGPAPPVDFYVAYYASQRKGESIYSPETCLPGAGWVVEDARPVRVSTRSGSAGTFQAKRVVLRKFDETMIAYFWFDLAGRTATNAYQVKLFNFWNALTRQRTDGALVRVMTPVALSESEEAAERRLRRFLDHAVPVLEDYLGRG